jgi:hypothetical protein
MRRVPELDRGSLLRRMQGRQLRQRNHESRLPKVRLQRTRGRGAWHVRSAAGHLPVQGQHRGRPLRDMQEGLLRGAKEWRHVLLRLHVTWDARGCGRWQTGSGQSSLPTQPLGKSPWRATNSRVFVDRQPKNR